MNDELLEKARDAGRRLQAAEREAMLARADYHVAVRRLHLSGVPLRELAAALELSHQRVQQMVSSAGGSWWSRVWRTRKRGTDAVCTWCGRPPSEVSKLIAGPRVFICDACTAAARATVSGDRATPPFSGFTAKGVASRCSFCGKRPGRDRQVINAPPGRICTDCLKVCEGILEGSRS